MLLVSAGLARADDAEPPIPKAKGFVSDYVGVLDGSSSQQLNGIARELKERTGAEIAVVVVDTTQPLTAFDYAMKIAEAWKVGSREHDDGVVFLVAVRDRKMFILTGYGVEGALPDGRVGEIRDTLIVPAFRRGDFAAGIISATREIAAVIATDRGVQLTGVPPPTTHHRFRAPATSIWIPLAIIVIAMLLSQLQAAQRGGFVRRRGPFGGPTIGGGFGGFGGGFGGFGGSGGGGGFGGFGGGSFGGGGAGGDW